MLLARYDNFSFRLDATDESYEPGRLINHMPPGFENLKPTALLVDSKPVLVFVAKEFIPPGLEVSYDYNETRRDHRHEWMYPAASHFENQPCE